MVPVLDNQVPAPGAIGVDKATSIKLNITDPNLDPTSVIIKINNVVAWTGEKRVPRVASVEVDAIPNGFRYSFIPALNFDFYETVQVDVYAQDTFGSILDENYTFTIQDDPYPYREIFAYWSFRKTGTLYLDDVIEFDGYAPITPILRYEGIGADAYEWAPAIYGEILDVYDAYQSVSSPEILGPAPFTLPDEYVVNFPAGSRSYQITGNTLFGNIDGYNGTPYGYDAYDVIIEVVCRSSQLSTGKDQVIFSKRDPVTGKGYALYRVGESSDREFWRFEVDDGVSSSFVDSHLINEHNWNHHVIMWDRDARFQAWTDGLLNTSTNFVTAQSISADVPFTIGSETDGYNLFENGGIAYIAIWLGPPGWIPTSSSEKDAFIRRRFSRMTGLLPEFERGGFGVDIDWSSAPGPSGNGSIEIYDPNTGVTYAHFTGARWKRIQRNQPVGTFEVETGMIQEPKIGNNWSYPNNFDYVAWIKDNCTIESHTSSVRDPGSGYFASGIKGDGTDNVHGINRAVTGWWGRVISVWAKKGAVDFLYLELDRTSQPDAYGYFDLANGIVGTTYEVDKATMRDYGNGWYRCSIYANNEVQRGYIYAVDSDQGVEAPTYVATTDEQIYLFRTQNEQTTWTSASNKLGYGVPLPWRDGGEANGNDYLSFDITSGGDLLSNGEIEFTTRVNRMRDGPSPVGVVQMFKTGDIANGRVFLGHAQPTFYINPEDVLYGRVDAGTGAHILDNRDDDGLPRQTTVFLNDGYTHSLALRWNDSNKCKPYKGLQDGTVIDWDTPTATDTGVSGLDRLEFGRGSDGPPWYEFAALRYPGSYRDVYISRLRDGYGPIFANRVPFAGASNVDRQTDILISVLDEHSGVAPLSLDAYVEGNHAYRGDLDMFLPPYDGPGSMVTLTTTIEGYDSYNILIDRSLDGYLPPNAPISVRAFAEDFAEWCMDYTYTFTTMGNPPRLENEDPTPSETGVIRNKRIEFDVLESVDGYNLRSSSIDAYVEGVLAFDGLGFIYPYDASGSLVAPITDGYHFNIEKTGLFDSDISVNVRVTATDDVEVALDETYSFITEDNALRDVFVSIEEGIGSGYNPVYDGYSTSFVPPYFGTVTFDDSDGYDGYMFVIEKTEGRNPGRTTVLVTSESFIDDGYDISPAPFSLDVNPETPIEFKLRLTVGGPVITGWQAFIMGGRPLPCFLGGTEILTSSGGKNIEDIAVGDTVWAYDSEKQKVAVSVVTQTFKHWADAFLTLEFANGRVLHVTENHPMVLLGEGISSTIEAKSLSEGDLLYVFGKPHPTSTTVRKITRTAGRVKVYNISVARYRNYFAEAVLTHNK